VSYEANTNFKTCSCDLTANSCDPFCCCDTECAVTARTQWTASSQCVDVTYQSEVTHRYPLSGCLNKTAQFDYNSQKGLEAYFDPFSALMCVQINNAPDIADFYIANNTITSNEEIQKITTDTTKMGFVQTVFRPDGLTRGGLTYEIGDKMKSVVSGSTLRNQYDNGFPLPKPDSFGVCDNFKSAHFMLDDKSSCMQMADFETECSSLLNAEYYSSLLQFYMG